MEKECRTSIKETWNVILRLEWAKRPKSLKAQWVVVEVMNKTMMMAMLK
jgi:hypothetical protein